MAGLQTDKIVLSNEAYVRFHGFDSNYGGDYPETILFDWAKWIQLQTKQNISVYAYFNNDLGGYAVKNCMALKSMVQD
jgi:uncharacterized protein YecE (DUF72 family)